MEEQIYHIIVKQLSGSAINDAEKLLFEEWLQAADSPAKYDDFVKIWKTSAKIEYKLDVDIDLEWNRFKQLRDNHQINKSKIRRLTMSLSSIAAGLILLFGMYFFFSQSNKPQRYLSNNEVLYIELPDHSQVWLNKNSTLQLEKSFGKKERTVQLSGEAFFEVTKNPEHPFVINTNGGIGAKVLGTSFNLRCYQYENNVELQVINGRVVFGNLTKNQVVFAQKGEQISYSLLKNDFFNAQQVDPNLLSWKTGLFQFNNSPLSEVIPSLERYLEIKIKLPEGTEQLKYSGKFTNPSAGQIADILSIAMGWEYEISDNTIIFTVQ